MNNDEFYEYEDRAYINPTLSSGEQEAFISNLRDIQGQNNAQIAQQTYNLGTAVPSNLGGLGGGEAYFTSRYQTPQVNDMVATLKSAAQAQALSDVMSNYQNQLQNRYKQAYRRAQKRSRSRGSGTNPTAPTNPTTNNNVEKKSIEKEYGEDPFSNELMYRNMNPGKTKFDYVDELIQKRRQNNPTKEEQVKSLVNQMNSSSNASTNILNAVATAVAVQKLMGR